MHRTDSSLPVPASRPADLWMHVIEGAETEHDVVLAVREYLAMWGPEELARVPVACRPGKITDAEDIADLAYRVSCEHLEFDGPAGDRALLERLMGFVGHAGKQVARIAARAQSRQADPQ